VRPTSVAADRASAAASALALMTSRDCRAARSTSRLTTTVTSRTPTRRPRSGRRPRPVCAAAASRTSSSGPARSATPPGPVGGRRAPPYPITTHRSRSSADPTETCERTDTSAIVSSGGARRAIIQASRVCLGGRADRVGRDGRSRRCTDDASVATTLDVCTADATDQIADNRRRPTRHRAGGPGAENDLRGLLDAGEGGDRVGHIVPTIFAIRAARPVSKRRCRSRSGPGWRSGLTTCTPMRCAAPFDRRVVPRAAPDDRRPLTQCHHHPLAHVRGCRRCRWAKLAFELFFHAGRRPTTGPAVEGHRAPAGRKRWPVRVDALAETHAHWGQPTSQRSGLMSTSSICRCRAHQTHPETVSSGVAPVMPVTMSRATRG